MKKAVFQFILVFVIVLLVDITIGFTMTIIVGQQQPSYWILKIDEIISFPSTQWNRAFPEHGIYRATTNAFWLVIVFNAFFQALLVFALLKFFRMMRKGRK